jgi:hypothetical protein
MKVKELIEELKKLDQEKDIMMENVFSSEYGYEYELSEIKIEDLKDFYIFY